jgi:hypothetical protein
VLLPLKLEELTRKSSYRILAAGEYPEFNQTLTERLKRGFGISLGVEMDEETTLADVFAAVRSAVATQPGWEVLEEAHVALFQFHKLKVVARSAMISAVPVPRWLENAYVCPSMTMSSPGFRHHPVLIVSPDRFNALRNRLCIAVSCVNA